MSNIDLLLDGELNNGEIVLEIDEYNRAIIYDGDLLLGVKGVYKAEKVIFRSPTILSNRLYGNNDEIDLSDDNVKIYINYENANGDVYIHRCTKGNIIESDGARTIEFYWELSSNVTLEAGVVRFMVCAKKFNASVITNEWHTAIFSGKVLDALNVDNHTQVTDPDLSTSINDLKYEVDSVKNMINDLTNGGVTMSAIDSKLTEIKNEAVTHTHDSNAITYLKAKPNKESLTATLDDIYTILEGLGADTGTGIDIYNKTDVDGLLSTLSASKADVTHNHNSGEIYYPNKTSANKKDLKTTLDDVYSKLNNKTDSGHTHIADNILYNNGTVSSALDSLRISKANVKYVDENFLLKSSFSDLYEHNIILSYKNRSSKILQWVVSFKLISSKSGKYTKNDIFGDLKNEIMVNSGMQTDVQVKDGYIQASGVVASSSNMAPRTIYKFGYRWNSYNSITELDIGYIASDLTNGTIETHYAGFNDESTSYLDLVTLSDDVRKITKI